MDTAPCATQPQATLKPSYTAKTAMQPEERTWRAELMTNAAELPSAVCLSARGAVGTSEILLEELLGMQGSGHLEGLGWGRFGA